MATLRLTDTAILTTDHASSSYGQPVLVFDDGRVYGPDDHLGPHKMSVQEFVTATEPAGANGPIPDLLRDFLRLCSRPMIITLQLIGPPNAPTPEQLREWREAEDLTQTQSAIIAGVDLRSWQRWEYGEREVPQWLADVLRQRYGSAP